MCYNTHTQVHRNTANICVLKNVREKLHDNHPHPLASCVWMCMDVCVCACAWMCVCVCMDVCVCACVCAWMCVDVCGCVCVCGCMCGCASKKNAHSEGMASLGVST